jgi:hypothetical protein
LGRLQRATVRFHQKPPPSHRLRREGAAGRLRGRFAAARPSFCRLSAPRPASAASQRPVSRLPGIRRTRPQPWLVDTGAQQDSVVQYASLVLDTAGLARGPGPVRGLTPDPGHGLMRPRSAWLTSLCMRACRDADLERRPYPRDAG